tara:strand:- start:61 stop:192 length:132 start_codon:yes stop_codon:yes gene_type:complete
MTRISINDAILYEGVLYVVFEDALYMYDSEIESIVLTESPAQA